MSRADQSSFHEKARMAVAEIESLILQRFPEATFVVERPDDHPELIHLHVTADVEDLTDLIEAAIDRQVEMLVDDDIAIFVIPHRTPERNRAIEEAMRVRQVGAPATLGEHP